MEKPNGSGDLIDILTAVTAGAGGGDFNIVGIELNIRRGDFREDNNGGSRGVDSAMFFGYRYSLNPMGTGFPLELIKGTNTGDFDYVCINLGGKPSDFGSIAAIHAHQIIHPEAGFFAAGTGTEFENGNIRINGRHLIQFFFFDFLGLIRFFSQFFSFEGNTLSLFFPKLINSSFDVDKFLSAGKKWMTKAANFDFDFFDSRTGGIFVATGTSYGAVIKILRMNSGFHRVDYINKQRNFLK